MLGNRSRDTVPELALRSLLHARGLRYRVDTRPLPDVNRRADIVFRPALVAVFMHGCYWHGCEIHYSQPKTNPEYWSTKVATNMARDADTIRRLRRAGWHPVVIWEHEDMARAAGRIARVVAARRERFGR
jgi:DNA mismatch endonuclease (patch repair protein)